MSDKNILKKVKELSYGSLWTKLQEDAKLELQILKYQGEVITRQMTEEEKEKYRVNEYKNTNKGDNALRKGLN